MKSKISNRKAAFATVMGDDGGVSLYNKFLTDTQKTKVQTPTLDTFVELYKNRVAKVEPELIRLSKIEEILLQIRAKEMIKEIKLSIVRGTYIYARTSFYRHDRKVKDIRVIVDTLTNQNKPFEDLYKNRKFMKLAKEKLIEAMDGEIELNITNYKRQYKN